MSFAYDPFGRRVEKRVTGLAPQVPVPVTTTYLYDGADIVLESVADGSTTVTTQYIHGPGIDEPLALVRNGQSYFYHADGLGSVVAITDSQQNIVQHYAYDAFGMVTPLQPDFANPYTYTGREWDPETGLYYYRARYYDAMEGRFISKDPIGFAGGDVNVYRYVKNNSVNLMDPSGLQPNQACVNACTAGGGVVGGGLGYAGGGILGGAGGTLVAPGVGTVGGAVSGAEAMGAAGAVGGSIVGRAVGELTCPDDDDGECEKKLKSDELLCDMFVSPIYGPTGVAICKKAAIQRYSECLRFGVNGINTPLSGVQTPL